MSKRIWKSVWLVAVISMVLAACASQQTPQVVEVTKIVNGEAVVVTTTPAPTENPYDDNAPITIWIDADRQPAFPLPPPLSMDSLLETSALNTGGRKPWVPLSLTYQFGMKL